MQCLEVSGAVRPIYGSFGVKRLMKNVNNLPRIQRNNKGSDNCSGLRKVMKTLDKLLKKKPLQAWTGPEGSRRLKFPYFKTVGT